RSFPYNNFKREKNALKQALFSLFYIPNCQKRDYNSSVHLFLSFEKVFIFSQAKGKIAHAKDWKHQ
ncbi:hypothetical protein, partial [Sharpea azabuensis]|uniref:hypothetical protein n=1 Tax=Sharpea azabuensis TaxID=322505 RepID=UPI0023F12181